MAIDEQQYKENMKELGRFGALLVAFFAILYLSIYLNLKYSLSAPWFLIVVVLGGFYFVPKAKNVMSMFKDNK